MLYDANPMNITMLGTNRGVVRKLDAVKFRKPSACSPPGTVTAIDYVGPRREPVVFLDR
jgi:hypothetical protein